MHEAKLLNQRPIDIHFKINFSQLNIFFVSLMTVAEPDNSMTTTADEMKAQVQEAVARDCVVVFSKTSCPACHRSKKLFNEIGACARIYELDKLADGNALMDSLAEMTGARTVH